MIAVTLFFTGILGMYCQVYFLPIFSSCIHFAAAEEMKEDQESRDLLDEKSIQILLADSEDSNNGVRIILSSVDREEDHDALQNKLDDEYYYRPPTGNQILDRINALDKDGRTALHISAQRGNVEIVQMLLAKGSNPNIKDNLGLTPLHCAVHSASVELVQKMLKNRVRPCRVDFKDLGGLTALHYASILGADEILDALLSHGANVDLLDYQGRTALNIAFMHGHVNIVRKLIEKGSTFNYPPSYYAIYSRWKKSVGIN